MRVLFDTNIVLDVLLDREPFSAIAADLFSRVELEEVEGFIGATTVTTIHYLACKVMGRKEALKAVGRLLTLFEVAPVNRLVLRRALDSGMPDYEDAVLQESARLIAAQAIVTRDKKGFRKSVIPPFDPGEMYKILNLGVK